jgi:hypothetical protein
LSVDALPREVPPPLFRATSRSPHAGSAVFLNIFISGLVHSYLGGFEYRYVGILSIAIRHRGGGCGGMAAGGVGAGGIGVEATDQPQVCTS